jgi:hypothetical protein
VFSASGGAGTLVNSNAVCESARGGSATATTLLSKVVLFGGASGTSRARKSPSESVAEDSCLGCAGCAAGRGVDSASGGGSRRIGNFGAPNRDATPYPAATKAAARRIFFVGVTAYLEIEPALSSHQPGDRGANGERSVRP